MFISEPLPGVVAGAYNTQLHTYKCPYMLMHSTFLKQVSLLMPTHCSDEQQFIR